MSLDAFRKNRAAHKRAAVLAAARLRFGQDGFARANMDAIAKAARVSTATLYRYFPSKAALFQAVAVASIEAMEADLPAENAAPLIRLERLAVAYARLLSTPEVRSTVRMLIAETGRGGDLAGRFYDGVKRRIGDGFSQVILDAARAGVVRAPGDPGHAAGQLQGMIEHATLMRGLILGDDVPPAQEAGEIARSALATWLARWGGAAPSAPPAGDPDAERPPL